MIEILNNKQNQLSWKIKQQALHEDLTSLMQSINVSEPVAQILIQRGIKTYNEAADFFNPSLEKLHNPYLMKNMDKAVNRIVKAIANNEKIMIYGDYDVDGTTSVALMYSFLKNATNNLLPYIPDRYTEGYGISKKGIDVANEASVSLIIALDCGITANELVDYANSLSIDFIICDHHLPEAKIPKAIAVLDPKQHDCNYPFKELSGCGVGFKLCQALVEPLSLEPGSAFKYLDLLAVSIASDIVGMFGENRILTHFGLLKLNENPMPGLKAILGLCVKNNKNADINEIVFRIGPRINAAGRMASAMRALEILLAENIEVANGLVQGLEGFNTERKETDRNVTQEALDIINEDSWYQNAVSTVVCGENWHKGVVGIVASRLIENHYKPTIVFAGNKGVITGSARTVEGFDIHKAITQCSNLIIQFGGHAHAAGLKIEAENFIPFREKFNQVVESQILPHQKIPTLLIDTKLELNQINDKFFTVLKRLSPFGPGNLRPIFFTENLKANLETKAVGVDLNHLRLVVEDNYGNKFSGIWFNKAELLEKFTSGSSFTLAFTLDENEFRGVKNIQLRPLDIIFN